MVDEYIIHNYVSLCWHITISIKQDIIILMVIMQCICGSMLIMGKCKILIILESYGGLLIFKHSNIIANQAFERASVQHFGCINGRILQALCTKHFQNFILIVNKPRKRAIVRQGGHNTSIIVIIASNTWERAIFQHIACNRR
jgi:hypothetical protein